jgi:hypothetical protein
MSLFSFAVASALLASVVASWSLSARRSLYFESHGRDDLREWPAAIAKGARYLKIDFNFEEDPYTCAVQTRLVDALPVDLRGLPPPQQFPNGCYVLAHYYANFTTDFNTTTDLVNLLNAPSTIAQLASLPDAEDGIVVQMCFKNKPPLSCDDSSSLSRKWIALMDDFYTKASPISRNTSRGSVRFVFDSLGLDEKCKFAHWPGWFATYTGSIPQTAVNDSVPLGYNEFRMVNMAAASTGAWDYLGANDFFKFINSSFAFVAWEPASQQGIASFQIQYLNYNLSTVHTSGMIMAYNGDPALFHVYSANTTQQHSNLAVGSPKSKKPSTVYFEREGVLLTCATLEDLSNQSLSVECSALRRRKNARFDPIITKTTCASGAGSTTQFTLDLPSLDGIFITPQSDGTYLLLFNSGSTLLMGTVAVSPALVTINTTDMTRWMANTTADAKLVSLSVKTGAQHDTWQFGIATLHATADSNFEIKLAFASGNRGEAPMQYVDSVLVTSNPFETATYPSDVSLHVDFTVGEDGVFAVVTWTANRSVYAAMITIATNTNSTVIPSPSVKPTKMGVGRSAIPRVLPTGHVGITFDSSFCYNSEMLDDDFFIFYGQKECNLQDAAVFELLPNPVLAYVYGHWSDVVARVGAGNLHRNGWATVCDADVLHGSFDLGQNPSPVLMLKDAAKYGDDSIPDGTHWFVAASESLSLPDYLCVCGTPIPHNERVVVDAFPLRGFYNRTAVKLGV